MSFLRILIAGCWIILGLLPASAQQVLGGFGPPVSSVGAEAQYYINFSTGYIYGPKSSGVWPTGAPFTALPIGLTPAITDTGVAVQMTGNAATYYQSILQNTNSGTTASTDYIVNNDQGTATTHYGDFGINSSTYSGTGSLALAGATYLYSQTGDLVLGTASANAVHFVINNGATDAASISTAGIWTYASSPLVSAALPTISACGTTPPAATAGSNSTSGQFTLGTGTPTACTVTFATAYPTAAFCTVSPASSGGAAITGGYYISAQSKTAFTLTIGTGTNSLVFNYTCSGN